MKKLILSGLLILIFTASCLPQHTSADLVEIHDIQGCGHISPLKGRLVENIQGIVTWKISNGFFLQGLEPDDLDCSSEAIFVFTDEYPETIPGDYISVSGTVNEFTPGDDQSANLSTTEIDAEKIEILSENNSLPDPVTIGRNGRESPSTIIEDDQLNQFDPETDGLDYYESLEGMRVKIEGAVTVGPRNKYNEVVVVPESLLQGNVLSSTGALIKSEEDTNPERITIELPDGFDQKVQLGDHIEEIFGVITYEYGSYRIIESNFPKIVEFSENRNLQAETLNPSEFRIVTYNTNNFDRFDESKVRKLAGQIVKNLRSPDILLLEEIMDDSGVEDDGTTTTEKNIQSLISQIIEFNGPEYQFLDNTPVNNTSGGIKGGNIRNVILYRTDRGLVLEDFNISLTSFHADSFSQGRMPITAKFSFLGKPFYFIGLHFTSNNLNTPDFGSIQPPEKPEEEKRIQQGLAIANYSAQISNGYNYLPVIVAGDFNDEPYSLTLQSVQKKGLWNLSDELAIHERYSIIFEGNACLFDQILYSENSEFTVKRIDILHLNSGLDESSQISDHDPFLADFFIN